MTLKDRDIVMVDKALYDTMVLAYNRVKAERFKNKIAAKRMKDEVDLLHHNMDAFGSKVIEVKTAMSNLSEIVTRIQDYNLKVQLGEKVETATYGVMEMEDKVHHVLRLIDALKGTLRPFDEYTEEAPYKE
jgi:predicted component of type VI protein secretion system